MVIYVSKTKQPDCELNTTSSTPTVIPLPASLLSVQEAAAYARVSAPTVRRWIKAKRVRYFRAGVQLRVDPADLVAFFARGCSGLIIVKNPSSFTPVELIVQHFGSTHHVLENDVVPFVAQTKHRKVVRTVCEVAP